MNIEALRKMLARGQDSAMLRFGLGKALLDDKQPAEAAEHLQCCVEQDADYSAAWKLLGRAHQQLGDVAAARADWQQALQAAARKGDKQTEREVQVFLKKLDK
jgi:predicted Zn-dependent protease